MTELDLAAHLLLEVEAGDGTFLNVTGPSMSLTVDRADGDVGELTAQVLDVDLDPAQATGVRPGRGVRFSVVNADQSGWSRVYTGDLGNPSVEYDPLAKAAKRANVGLQATDAVQRLAGVTEQRGVATIEELRWLVGTAVGFVINGSTTPLATGEVVAFNDNASLWDQILLTRDTALGYAWVDALGRLRVYDALQMSTAVAATLGPAQYRDLSVEFGLDQVINSVLINWRRTNIGTDTSSDVTYGPYEDAASIEEWGIRQATFTIQGEVEDEAAIEAYAQDVLARNATPQLLARTAVVPIRTVEDLALVRSIDVNSRVQVTLTDGVTVQTLRVVSIGHDISGDGWVMTLELAAPESVVMPSGTPGTGVSTIPPGSITDVELSQDVLDLIASSRDGQAPASSPTPTVRGGIGSLFVTWVEVANADPVAYDVHLSTSAGFTPAAGNLAGSVMGRGPLPIRNLPGTSTPLEAGTTYYVRIVARDADGPAPAGAEASGTPAQVTSEDIAVNAVTADMLVANDALIGALNTVDLSAVNFEAVKIDGGSIYIATGSTSEMVEEFSGTAFPAGWTSSSAAASVVAAGAAGQAGSAIELDFTDPASEGSVSYGPAFQVYSGEELPDHSEVFVRYWRPGAMYSTSSRRAWLSVRSTSNAKWSLSDKATEHGGFAVSLLPYSSTVGYEVVGPDSSQTLFTVPNPSEGYDYFAGQWMNARLRFAAGVVGAKVWVDGRAEPGYTQMQFYRTLLSGGRPRLFWGREPTTSSSVKIYVDRWEQRALTTGFVVRPDGSGEWPALGLTQGDAAWRVVGASGQPAFQNGWTAMAGEQVSFRKDPTGTVHIRGRLSTSGATANAAVFTLPVGYRPDTDLYFVGRTSNTNWHGNYTIFANGEVRYIGASDGGSPGWVSATFSFPGT